MATPKKAAPDPLTEQLPPAEPAKPLSADDLVFTVEISPYVSLAAHLWKFEIIEHDYKGYVGDHTGQREGGFGSAEEAEKAAADYIGRIRRNVAAKLNVPDAYRITL